ncbi:hypothetical protein [Curvibacter lanceolatus]|uniref:hypothetical protein n=1 Tax=Curvibacter lanceolatus TaxID=86182 RepID=UPI000373769C|nr:hypothetical protein [Curvibacter lanceolatus]
MTKWPEPVGHILDIGDFELGCKPYHSGPEWEQVYTADQVRSIVRAEMEECAKLCRQEWITEADREYGERLAGLIEGKIKDIVKPKGELNG